ncbi:HindIII family type II restriction endonuclease [Haemophilus influenzae]|uniref:HindIII family type II restriction endonuclease n=2 Tax=Haemophilus influenzae TaxID=727 RepID=UPI00059ABB2D|nr:HindIII family type II restriction endonuclease [Haemophilus influenzae]CVQ08894.1 Type-2 restriction enzyme HindIII [Streptococcus pneumoniae]MBK1413365.1 HindIII family type II restriction endonuclease [Haemophilus influenzae]MCK8898482.1 HindIII family type II restriction endonuclease [Haemophilus influenzae]MCK8934131.1 HindIII family type II restriction endonuclease [Haemophilus influenzae]MCK9021315.1 HindIII family type II restriction endonuclease [Haemophilus influenzae]
MKKSALEKLLSLIENLTNQEFKQATNSLISFIYKLNRNEVIELVRSIGILPEAIKPSSTQEKLFSKAGDIVLVKAFQLLNLNSKPLEQRGNAGDVIALSKEFNYGLVADAKSFRLSRTAKNQKDFKVKALSEWREDKDYAVLTAPFFQYPTTKSQIFKQSLDENVLLFSWEHLAILLQLDLEETNIFSFEQLWNFPKKQSKKTSVSDAENNFMRDFNKYFMDLFKIDKDTLNQLLQKEINFIEERSLIEKEYWKKQINIIKNFTREEAIEALLKDINMSSKIETIDSFIKGIKSNDRLYL